MNEWLDELITLEQFKATRTKALNSYLKTRREWIELFAPYTDSNGNFVDPAGTDGKLQISDNVLQSITKPAFSSDDGTSKANSIARQRLIRNVMITLDGGGNGSATIHAALANYVGCIQLIGFLAQNVGNETCTFSVTGGTLVGPNAHNLTTVASKLTPFGSTGNPSICLKGTSTTDQGKDLVVSVTGALLSQDIWVCVEGWYETP